MGFSVHSLVLTQTASLTWTLIETDSDGNTVSSLNGAGVFTTTTPQTGVPDAFLWKGFNWYDLTQQVIQDNNLDIAGADASSFSVHETNGRDAYRFEVANGREIITGVGTAALPEMLQSGGLTYAYTLTSVFTYANFGNSTFTLSEQGFSSAGSYSLDSIVYSETGDNTADPNPGFNFAYHESGKILKTGAGSSTSGQSTGGQSISLSQSIDETFHFSDELAYSYAESGSATSGTLTGNGSFANGSFNFDALTHDAQGAGSYSLDQAETETTVGTFTKIESSGGLQSYGGLFNSSNQTTRGTFVSTRSSSRSATGAGSFSLTDGGSYAGGSVSLGDVGLTENADSTYSYHQTDSYHDSGAGTFVQTGGGATQMVSVSGAFTELTSATDSLSETGAEGYSTTREGTGSATGSSLSCYVLGSYRTSRRKCCASWRRCRRSPPGYRLKRSLCESHRSRSSDRRPGRSFVADRAKMNCCDRSLDTKRWKERSR